MKFERIWAMPSHWTFTIKPIAKLLSEEMVGSNWIDPFAGEHSPANCTNDLNPERPTMYHMEALPFLKTIPDGVADGVLFDPPYSPRQLMECYKSVGISVTSKMMRANFWSDIKEEIARITKKGGKVISFGWQSGGVGKTLGFRLERILLVPHGGRHNDTICTVEIKI